MTDPRRNRLRLDSEGVTLIELMVALVVIAIGVLALSGVQTRSYTNVYATGRRTSALSVANAQMEVARGAGFTLARSDSGQTGAYRWRTQVDSVDVGLDRVVVSVTWSEKGRPRTVQLDNLLSSR